METPHPTGGFVSPALGTNLVGVMSATALATRLFATQPGTRVLIDAVLAVAVMAISLAQLSHGGITLNHPGSNNLDATAVVLVICCSAPIIAWRRSPFGVFALTAASSIALAGLGYPIDLAVGPTVALYLLTASRETSPWRRSESIVVIGLLALYLIAAAASQQTFPTIELLHTGLASAGAWFAGERTRLRREQMAEFKERAIRAEEVAERDRLLAVAEDRARIARDLHDSAGHAISVIAVRAGAARLRRYDDPERSLDALTAIEELARQTAEEIDQIVGTLRTNRLADAPVEAPSGLASLDTLVANQQDAGLDVTVEVVGAPSDSVGTAADQAVYRILQEALTNAARHGSGRAEVTLVHGGEAIELTVINPVGPREPPTSGGGHGIIGMRERATLLGGTLSAERDDGVFRIRASIPLGGHRS